MAHVWQGIIKEYADYLPEHLTTHIVTLGEGGTPTRSGPSTVPGNRCNGLPQS